MEVPPMRAPDRIPALLTALTDAWRQHPDLRLGQLIANACPPGTDLYHVEDNIVLAGLLAMDTSRESVAVGIRDTQR